MAPVVAYALCGTLRTGSTWLCRMLADRGLGRPDEYLEPRVRDALLALWGVPPGRYYRELWARRSPGGVFGIKLFWGQRFFPWVGGDFSRCLPVPLGRARFILQTRDSREQAISWVTARRTGDMFAGPPRPRVWRTRLEVAAFEQLVREHTESWRYWFRDRRLGCLELAYEDLAADPGAAVAAVREYVLRP